jgi:peptidylprolyl isomerase
MKYFLLAALIGVMTLMANGARAESDPDNTLLMELKNGIVTIELRPDLAPNHVKRIKELVQQHFYDGVPFHRVISGFMAQTGDPTGTGLGGSGQKLQAEFTPTPQLRGTVSMARASDPNSADSQFFIVLADSPFLNNQYTVFGQVSEGMDLVDAIKKGDPVNNGKVDDPDKIITLRLASDPDLADQ